MFLNACQTAQGGRTNYNAGVAPGLIEDGVSAVVANQYSVFDRSATLFAKQFYWCLARVVAGGCGTRVTHRDGLFRLRRADWAVPVLFGLAIPAKLCEALIRSDVPRALSASFAAEAAAVRGTAERTASATPEGKSADTTRRGDRAAAGPEPPLPHRDERPNWAGTPYARPRRRAGVRSVEHSRGFQRGDRRPRKSSAGGTMYGGTGRSVPIVLGLIRPFDRHADVVGLLLASASSASRRACPGAAGRPSRRGCFGST